MYDTILVPTDGSEGSERAVDRAIDLANQYDTEVHVLHVVSTDDLAAAHGELVQPLEASGQKIVESTVDRISEAGIEPVEHEILLGTPPRAICSYIDDEDVDLVVIGTHGRSGLSRYLIGSVAEKVVRMSPVPVLTVPVSNDEV